MYTVVIQYSTHVILIQSSQSSSGTVLSIKLFTFLGNPWVQADSLSQWVTARLQLNVWKRVESRMFTHATVNFELYKLLKFQSNRRTSWQNQRYEKGEWLATSMLLWFSTWWRTCIGSLPEWQQVILMNWMVIVCTYMTDMTRFLCC